MKNLLEQTKPKIENELTPGYAARFLFHSFRHSQGNQYLQGLIISYVHSVRPSWRVNEEDKPIISNELGRLLSSYEKMKQKGVHASNTIATSPYGTDQAFERALYLMIFLNQDRQSKPELVEEITDQIINQDHLFLTRENGRNKKDPDINSPLHDNWLSHIVHFGINLKPSGLAEFNEMYRDIRAHALSEKLDQESRKKFLEVLKIYKDKHPEGVLR